MFAVYALRDTCINSIRYIGYSKHHCIRFDEHLNPRDNSRQKNEWIKHVYDSGHVIYMTVIDLASTEQEAKIKEAYWIQYFHQIGVKLVNQQFPHSPLVISPQSVGMIEGEIAIEKFDSFIASLDAKILCFITGIKRIPEIQQGAINLSVTEPHYWAWMLIKWLKRLHEDKILLCYRYKLPGCQWALFGDDQHLTRRLNHAISQESSIDPLLLEHLSEYPVI